MPALIIWIRRDRSDGKETEVKQEYVEGHIAGSYSDLKLALKGASKNAPLTNGFADYYPKESVDNKRESKGGEK